MLLNELGEGQAGDASVGEELIITTMYDAINDWFGLIEEEKGEGVGRLIILVVGDQILFPIVKFCAGSVISELELYNFR
jgi:hypothetical protein